MAKDRMALLRRSARPYPMATPPPPRGCEGARRGGHEAEVTELTGVASDVRDPKHRLTSARATASDVGTPGWTGIGLAIPKVRDGSYFPSLLEPVAGGGATSDPRRWRSSMPSPTEGRSARRCSGGLTSEARGRRPLHHVPGLGRLWRSVSSVVPGCTWLHLAAPGSLAPSLRGAPGGTVGHRQRQHRMSPADPAGASARSSPSTARAGTGRGNGGRGRP